MAMGLALGLVGDGHGETPSNLMKICNFGSAFGESGASS
jgi:hypothetical protein